MFLVENTLSNKFYAMKQMKKSDVIQRQQFNNIFSERDIHLLFIDYNFICNLYATLQDDQNLYFIQEYIHGGDLWNFLYENNNNNNYTVTKWNGLPITFITFYISNILVILEYIHNKEVVFRDIKPENFLIDNDGYLKITDFGSAKKICGYNKTYTLCGCAQYLSPEMILSKEYDKSIDFWSLGILIYELLTKSTPFMHDNMAMIYQNIIESEENLKIILNPLEKNSKSLISQLLTSNPIIRLGMLRNGINDIWEHNFFSGFARLIFSIVN